MLVAMSKKRLAQVLAPLAALALAATVVLWPRPSRITQANYRLIRYDMTRQDVTALLGPPGDYLTRPCVYTTWEEEKGSSEEAGGDHPEEWRGDEGRIWVWFDARGRPCEKTLHRPVVVEQTPLEYARWRLERAWKRQVP